MIRNLSRGTTLASAPRYAKTFFARFLGLMGRKTFPEGSDALIFVACPSIHCFFMRMTIDAVFVDREGRVTQIFPGLKPWRLAFGGKGAYAVIELPAGVIEATRTAPGDRLEIAK